MYNRCACFQRLGALTQQFGIIRPPTSLVPSWNVRLGHDAPVVRRHPKTGVRHLDLLRWGLARQAQNTRNRPCNVKAEDVADEASELHVLAQSHRCLVPVDAFYAWYAPARGEGAFAVRRRDHETMALAGLWNLVEDPLLGEAQRTFAILTLPATGVMDVLHDRMPVVLEEADWPLWLGEVAGDPMSLLRDQVGPDLWAWQVSDKVLLDRDKVPKPAKAEPSSSWFRTNSSARFGARQAIEYPPMPPRDGEELSPVYEVKSGGPFICFQLAGQAVGWSRSRLEAVRHRYDAVIGPPTQPEVAFQRTAEALAGHLLETQRLCARLGLQIAAPANTAENPVWDGFGYVQDLVRLDDGLVEISRIVHTWPSCADTGLPWPDPDSAAALYRDGDAAYREAWHGRRRYGGRVHAGLATIASAIGSSPLRRSVFGASDLIGAAERFASLAHLLVAGLEITASIPSEMLGRALPVYDPSPPGKV